MLSSRLDAGREPKTGNSEAHQLALTTPQGADGIAHEKDLSEVIAAQGGSPKRLPGTELALDRNTIPWV